MKYITIFVLLLFAFTSCGKRELNKPSTPMTLSDFVQKTDLGKDTLEYLEYKIESYDEISGLRILVVPAGTATPTEDIKSLRVSVFLDLDDDHLSVEAANEIKIIISESIELLEPENVTLLDKDRNII